MATPILNYTETTIQNLKNECECADMVCQEILQELDKELPHPSDPQLQEAFIKVHTIYMSSLSSLFYTYCARRTLALTTLDSLLTPLTQHLLGTDNSLAITNILSNHSDQMQQLKAISTSIDIHAYQWKKKLLSLLSADER